MVDIDNAAALAAQRSELTGEPLARIGSVRDAAGKWAMCVFGFTALVALFVWAFRIHAFADALKRVGDSKHSFGDAFGYLISDAGGWLSLLVLALSFLVMYSYWRKYVAYLCEINRPDTEKQFETWQLSAMEELNDPPGDIFTLIGIAFTFLGLTISMIAVPGDLIAQVFSGPADGQAAQYSHDVARALSATAIIFGTSLAVGLLASLQGVALSIGARVLAAKYRHTISSPSRISHNLNQLNKMSDVVKVLNTAGDAQAPRRRPRRAARSASSKARTFKTEAGPVPPPARAAKSKGKKGK